jgi:hypothetical protein
MLQSKNLERTGEGIIMKFKSLGAALALSIFSILFLGSAISNAQTLAEDLRPFDFSDSYYKDNGIKVETLTSRKNGGDGLSVADFSTDPAKFADIRILETLPAYGSDGNAIYWNSYGVATRESFTSDEAGIRAAQAARNYPVFMFPSSSVRGTDRQAALIAVDKFYFDNNPLGLGRVVLVEFNTRLSRADVKTLNMLAERNGTSLDGTPIIRTTAELDGLISEGIVTLRADEQKPFIIGRVMQYPDRGAITPDAFLDYVKNADGEPLVAERHFVSKFECLKNGSRTCL